MVQISSRKSHRANILKVGITSLFQINYIIIIWWEILCSVNEPFILFVIKSTIFLVGFALLMSSHEPSNVWLKAPLIWILVTVITFKSDKNSPPYFSPSFLWAGCRANSTKIPAWFLPKFILSSNSLKKENKQTNKQTRSVRYWPK